MGFSLLSLSLGQEDLRPSSRPFMAFQTWFPIFIELKKFIRSSDADNSEGVCLLWWTIDLQVYIEGIKNPVLSLECFVAHLDDSRFTRFDPNVWFLLESGREHQTRWRILLVERLPVLGQFPVEIEQLLLGIPRSNLNKMFSVLLLQFKFVNVNNNWNTNETWRYWIFPRRRGFRFIAKYLGNREWCLSDKKSRTWPDVDDFFS